VDPVVEAARWEQKAWLHVREKESFRHVSDKRSSSIRLRRARCSIRVGIAGGDDISPPALCVADGVQSFTDEEGT
jgi:hypothetical protein